MIRNSLFPSAGIHSGPPAPTRSSSSAAPAASSSSQHYGEDHWEPVQNLSPPTLEQLRSLTFLPSALVSRGLSDAAGKGRDRRGQRSRRTTRLAREGQIVSKTFDALGASRPQPTNGISLEQSITLEMTYQLGLITSSATSGVPTYASSSFNIGTFSGAASLLSVFDQYRFEQIEVWLESSTPNSAIGYPAVSSAVDLDDANTPTSIGQVQDHQGSICTFGPGGHYHKWRPHIAVASFSGAFTSYSNVPAMWIDSASPSVQHYGLKVATSSQGAAVSYLMTVRAVVSFRAPAIN